jgi:hypothetical protein
MPATVRKDAAIALINTIASNSISHLSMMVIGLVPVILVLSHGRCQSGHRAGTIDA